MKKKDLVGEPGTGFDYATAFSSKEGKIGFQISNTKKWVVIDFSKKKTPIRFVRLKSLKGLLKYLEGVLDDLNILYYGDMDLERVSEVLDREVENMNSRENQI